MRLLLLPLLLAERTIHHFVQVLGCCEDLQLAKTFHRKSGICQMHSQAERVEDGMGRACRFCQQCGRLHELSAFDGVKRWAGLGGVGWAWLGGLGWAGLAGQAGLAWAQMNK